MTREESRIKGPGKLNIVRSSRKERLFLVGMTMFPCRSNRTKYNKGRDLDVSINFRTNTVFVWFLNLDTLQLDTSHIKLLLVKNGPEQ
jgi:hypothetical protein